MINLINLILTPQRVHRRAAGPRACPLRLSTVLAGADLGVHDDLNDGTEGTRTP